MATAAQANRSASPRALLDLWFTTDLLRAERLTPDGRLPPVVPVVLYNGRPRWTAATELADLLAPPPAGLAGYQPRLRYLLLEERRFAAEDLAPMRNLAVALFQLENSRGPEELQQVMARLVEGLQAPEQANVRRAFAVWRRGVWRRCSAGRPGREGRRGARPATRSGRCSASRRRGWRKARGIMLGGRPIIFRSCGN